MQNITETSNKLSSAYTFFAKNLTLVNPILVLLSPEFVKLHILHIQTAISYLMILLGGLVAVDFRKAGFLLSLLMVGHIFVYFNPLRGNWNDTYKGIESYVLNLCLVGIGLMIGFHNSRGGNLKRRGGRGRDEEADLTSSFEDKRAKDKRKVKAPRTH